MSNGENPMGREKETSNPEIPSAREPRDTHSPDRNNSPETALDRVLQGKMYENEHASESLEDSTKKGESRAEARDIKMRCQDRIKNSDKVQEVFLKAIEIGSSAPIENPLKKASDEMLKTDRATAFIEHGERLMRESYEARVGRCIQEYGKTFHVRDSKP
jgi:hypothetical protein